MLFCLLLLALISLYQLKIAAQHKDYMSKEQTDANKGFFTAVVLFSHMRQCMQPVLPGDAIAADIFGAIGQLMVTVFFFYSGYGIFCSVQKKENYGNGFFRNRFLKTWLHFAVAVACYLVLSFAVGKEYTWQAYLLCWTGWTSLGNSNWFVFVMLTLYLITWIGLLLTKKVPQNRRAVIIAALVTALSVVTWILLYKSGKQFYWYNTLMCYPAGMWFGWLKPRFDQMISKWYLRAGLWIVSLAVFISCSRVYRDVTFSIAACVFCLLITLLNTNIKIDNPILRWLGKNTFTIYIFQRIPMIILQQLGLAQKNVVFIVLTVAGTLVLSALFERVYRILDSLVDKKN